MAGLAFDIPSAARRSKKSRMGESRAGAVARGLHGAVAGSAATKRNPDAFGAGLREGTADGGAGTRALKRLMALRYVGADTL